MLYKISWNERGLSTFKKFESRDYQFTWMENRELLFFTVSFTAWENMGLSVLLAVKVEDYHEIYFYHLAIK